MKHTKNASLDEIRAMYARGEVKAPDEGTPSVDVPDGFWDTAEVRAPLRKQQVNLRVDPDIIAFFKAEGNGHLTRMHAVLRSYVDAKTRQSG